MNVPARKVASPVDLSHGTEDLITRIGDALIGNPLDTAEGRKGFKEKLGDISDVGIDKPLTEFRAAERPATQQEIKGHLAAIFACYPNNRSDAFPSIMVQVLEREGVQIGPLKRAVDAILLTHKFMPSIQEIASEIKKEQQALKKKKGTFWQFLDCCIFGE